MPTFREDVKIGAKVPMMKTDDYNDQSVTKDKIRDGNITSEKLADGAVTAQKLAPSIRQEINDSVTASNEATEKAKEAAAKADQATENAKQATVAATAAKEAADTATQAATTATTASVQATEQAKSATTKAEESAAKANEAAQKADDSREQTEQTLGTMQEVVDKVAIKDEEGALVETPFRYIQNEEFIFAKVDSNDKLLFGIQWDATPVFGKTSAVEDRLQSQVTLLAERVATIIGDEDTTNVIDTMNELKKFFAEIENTETLTGILANLNSLNTKFGEDIKNLQNTKVDKEEGKSLIEDEVKECFRVIENEEFIKAIVDSDDKVLFGFYRATGKPYYPLNEMYHVIQNEEYFAAWVTTDDKVVLGLRRDGQIIGEIHAVNALKKVISQLQSDLASLQEKVGTIDVNLKELLDVFSLQENPEYLAVEKDADGRVLSATYNDGSHYIHNAKSETIPEEFSSIEDPEGRTEITTDAENKILGYRDSKGTRHEHKISTKHLELSDEAAKEVNEAFKSAGVKMEYPSDFSKDNHIELPIPRIAAQVNLYAQRLPMSKTDDISAKLEYVDKDGNYFVKDVVLNSQGSSSMGYIDPITGERGNLSVDFVDGTLITFGDWVSQDSFHFKKYYIDVFRGQCIVGYRLTEQVYKSHPIGEQYPYEKYISNNNAFSGLGVINKDFNTGAKCHPEGFPIHINFIKTSTGKNTDLGIYTWNLKKSNEVYYMNKKKATNILLDGIFNGRTLWEGKIDWGQFEIRNPKSLIDINGNKYDGDNPKELSDTDANSKKVKDSLVRLSNALSDIKSNLNKETFEKYFLVNPFVDYVLISQVIYNKDGFDKNWIWASWDGQLFTPTLYDLDSIFGSESSGIEVDKNSIETILGMEQYLPSYYLQTLYATEIKNRYKELRNNGIFSVDNIMNLLEGWLEVITYKYLNEDIKKYNETPSYRDSCISDKWNYISYNWTSDTDYDVTKTYKADEQCRYYGCLFSAKENVTGIAPLTKLYDTKPKVLGYYNSPIRVKNWLKKRFTYLDIYYNFK